jgi:hypothetical protein
MSKTTKSELNMMNNLCCTVYYIILLWHFLIEKRDLREQPWGSGHSEPATTSAPSRMDDM